MTNTRNELARKPDQLVAHLDQRLWLVNFAVFIGYFLTAVIGLPLHAVSGFATFIWAPAGIALAGLLLTGFAVWPAVFLGAFFANLVSGGHLPASLAIAVGNTLEPALATYVLREACFSPTMSSIRSVMTLFLTVIATTLIAATIGATSLWLQSNVSSELYAKTWFAWWFGDMMGAFVVTPLILAVRNELLMDRSWPFLVRRLEAATLGLALWFICGISFFDWFPPLVAGYPIVFLLFPLLIWASTRFGQLGATALTCLAFAAAVYGTMTGRGPFARSDVSEGFMRLYFFISTISITGLVLAVSTARLRTAELFIRARKEDLEREVAARSEELLVINTELRKKEYFLDQAQHIAHICVWEWNIKEDKVFWSEECFKIFGVTPATFKCTLQGYLDFLPAYDRDRVRSLLEQALREKSSYYFEHYIETPAGEKKAMRCRGNVILNENHEVTGMVGTAQDVTEQKHAEERLIAAQAAAEEANQAKTQFITNMSHEIRTPLGIVLGLSELLGEAEISESERRSFLKSLRQNGLWLSELINDVLDLSKIEAGQIHVEPSTVSLLEMLADIRQLLGPRAHDVGLKLQFTFRGYLPDRFRTDPMRLRQIFMNIIGNAVKFTASGRVEVRTLLVRRGGKSVLAFDVADTGIGMTLAQQKKLFQPFTQADSSTKRRFGGTGLGLFLSQQLAKALGGNVEIAASRPGHGTVIRITIDPGPLETSLFSRYKQIPDMPDEALPTKASANLERALTGKSVLLVDDSIDNQKLIARFLKSVGAHVDEAANGAQGVEKALQGSYDVILMDIQMPVMDGMEATRTLRERGYRRPIIALTAHALSDERARCLRSGFSDYLSKPVSKGVLIEHVNHVS